jgi:hypothetical protein
MAKRARVIAVNAAMCEASHRRDGVLQAYKSLVEVEIARTRDDGNSSQRFSECFNPVEARSVLAHALHFAA